MFVYKLKSFLRPMAQFMPKLHASNAGRATKCLKRVNAVYISRAEDKTMRDRSRPTMTGALVCQQRPTASKLSPTLPGRAGSLVGGESFACPHDVGTLQLEREI